MPFAINPISKNQESATLTQKGCDGYKKASEARGVDISTTPGQHVHKMCRKVHCHPKYIESYKRKRECDDESQQGADSRFEYKHQCLYCDTGDKYGGKKAVFKLVPVRTHFIISKKWAQKVRGRIGYVNDLHAADAVYHQACSVNFRTHKQIPQSTFQVN